MVRQTCVGFKTIGHEVELQLRCGHVTAASLSALQDVKIFKHKFECKICEVIKGQTGTRRSGYYWVVIDGAAASVASIAWYEEGKFRVTTDTDQCKVLTASELAWISPQRLELMCGVPLAIRNKYKITE